MSSVLDRYRDEMTALVLRLDETAYEQIHASADREQWAREMADGLLRAGLCGEYEVIAAVAGTSDLAAYSDLLRGMARRTAEQRTEAARTRAELVNVRADLAALEPELPAMPLSEGALVVYGRRSDCPLFALAISPQYSAPAGEWLYGLRYVQFPERGEPSGGSSYSTRASELRLPTAPDERLIAAQYHAKARVIAAEKESKAAATQYEALQQSLALMDAVSAPALASAVAA